jgi:hypothetical protein
MQTQIHFYNTIQASEPEMKVFNEKAIKGDAIVLKIFELNPNACLTPREVHTITQLQGHSYELNSIRRSINTLTNCDNPKLIKLGKEYQKKECKGVNNCTWKLK